MCVCSVYVDVQRVHLKMRKASMTSLRQTTYCYKQTYNNYITYQL